MSLACISSRHPSVADLHARSEGDANTEGHLRLAERELHASGEGETGDLEHTVTGCCIYSNVLADATSRDLLRNYESLSKSNTRWKDGGEREAGNVVKQDTVRG